jgi:radical SAM protein with 4Fe4S-binding SPASM domain
MCISVTDDITSAMAGIERWLGNPVTRALLTFVAEDDECGNRLSNAIDSYLGADKDLCWKCRLAEKFIGYTIHKSGKLFGIEEDVIRDGLADPVYKRALVNVIRGITRYGVTKPQIVNAPFLVVWDFTHMCNLKCSHCYQDARTALDGELDCEESKRLIDEMVDAGVVVIAFSGGEALMRKDFFEVASYAKGRHMYVALASNGTLITPEVAGRIASAGIDYVEISIDGKDAVSHDTMRGIPGAFDRTVQGIKNCINAGIYTCIATTVTSDNYHQVPEIHKLSEDLGANRLMFFNFIPTGRGAEIVDKDISPCQREDLLKFLLNMDLAGGHIEALSTAPQIARVAVEDESRNAVPVGHFHMGEGLSGKTRALADFIGGCGAGRLYCSVEPTGDIQPCVFMPITLGNIREHSFLDIWHGSSVLADLRDRSKLEGHCGECKNKLICGGCRARAYAYYNNLNAPDPGCINNIGHWNMLCASANATPEVIDRIGQSRPDKIPIKV